MADESHSDRIAVPDLLGRQALDAWLTGHDLGLFVQGPDPDGHPLLNGRVVDQSPAAGRSADRWDVVTVWIEDGGDGAEVREPRRPLPNHLEASGTRDPEDP